MKGILNVMVAVGLVVILGACATTSKVAPTQSGNANVETSVAEQQHKEFMKLWFQGNVEQAYAAARKENKPIFLYWGAVWCPPCNELKSQVFSQPQFQQLMSSFIPVYLDGDTEQAQVWGEKLKASGYPTVLVQLPDGKEISRISGDINIEEFADTIAGVLAAKRPLQDTVALALTGKATDDDWKILTYVSWGQLDDPQFKDAPGLKTRMTLIKKVPARLSEARAILAAGVLEDAAGASEKPADKAHRKAIDQVKKLMPTYSGYVLKDLKTKLAARRAIIYSSAAIVGWVYPKGQGRGYGVMKKRWLDAVADLSQSPEISVDNRLWTAFAPVEFFRLENAGKPVDIPLVEAVQSAVQKADADAKTLYLRHSIISGAAYMLGEVGDFAGARLLLEKEVKTTDTPWYYQSALANLEYKAGREAEALKWSQAARESAKGRATKLQWLVSDLAMVAKSKSNDRDAQLGRLAKEYYEMAFSLTDGFAGRNASTAKKVARNLADHRQAAPVRKVVETFAPQCQGLSAEGRAVCQSHFEELLK